jgi:FO synthase
MEETISRMAGSSYGSYRSVRELRDIATAAGRPTRQRTTTYGQAPDERVEVGELHDGHLPELLPVLEN